MVTFWIFFNSYRALYNFFFFKNLLDIIFFIYLYQRWIYPVDKKRTNEFGTSGEGPQQEAVTNEQEQSQVGQIQNESHLKSE
jgi:hypothetical protein